MGSSWLWISDKCFQYFDDHGEAPGRNIETIWSVESSKLDPDTRADLESILSGLSREYEEDTEPLNAEHLIQECQKWFSLEICINTSFLLQEAAEAGDLESCNEILSDFQLPQVEVVSAINPFTDSEALRKAFEQPSTSLVNLGGALQECLGNQIIPDSFIALLGKEKVGKTWFMQALLFGALRRRKNALWYQCGDLSASQQDLRVAIQMTGKSSRLKYCKEMLSPVLDCRKNQDGSCDKKERPTSHEGVVEDKSAKPYPSLLPFEDVYDYVPCTNCESWWPSTWWEKIHPCNQLTWQEARIAGLKLFKTFGDCFRRECFSNKTQSVSSLRERTLKLYESTGWKPDLVIIDYADNLDSEPRSSKEFRHQEEAKWAALRRWSQDEQIAVITATQAPRNTRRKRLLTDEDMSEDKRKKAHVTGFFGLNRDLHDKAMGWLRINSLLAREDDYDEKAEVAVLQLIGRGRPNLGSAWLTWKGEVE